MAAPVEAAVAPLARHLFDQIVASTAAQRRTGVAAGAGAIASTAVRAFDVRQHVLLAKIWRLLKVKQRTFHSAFVRLLLPAAVDIVVAIERGPSTINGL